MNVSDIIPLIVLGLGLMNAKKSVPEEKPIEQIGTPKAKPLPAPHFNTSGVQAPKVYSISELTKYQPPEVVKKVQAQKYVTVNGVKYRVVGGKLVMVEPAERNKACVSQDWRTGECREWIPVPNCAQGVYYPYTYRGVKYYITWDRRFNYCVALKVATPM